MKSNFKSKEIYRWRHNLVSFVKCIILVFFIPIARLNILPVDALTEAVAEFHIEDVLVLAAAIPSAVFL